MAKTEQKEDKRIALPEGRVINNSLFVKDKFDDKSTPSYKLEIAFPKDDTSDSIFDALVQYMAENYAELPQDESDPDGILNVDLVEVDGKMIQGKIVSGVLDGDALAKKREKKGKPGDAYKGMWVIRANTIYNKDGVDGPGGISVYDEDVKDVEPVNQGAIYNGCYGVAAVTIDDYDDNDGAPFAMKFYLSAFQKTRDGDKLTTPRDNSALFKPVGRAKAAAAGATGGRRSRKG